MNAPIYRGNKAATVHWVIIEEHLILTITLRDSSNQPIPTINMQMKE